jgi:hypothetical protein
MLLADVAAMAGNTIDDLIDLNSDGVDDYRRITQVLYTGTLYDVRVLVFSAEQVGTAAADLIADPEGHKVRAQIQTMIWR